MTKLYIPEVSVLALPSLAQTGSVTCLATRECLDLISGKELDMITRLRFSSCYVKTEQEEEHSLWARSDAVSPIQFQSVHN